MSCVTAPTSVERQGRQQFVEEHTQGVDVAAGVDVQVVEHRLLGAHVLRRADDPAETRVNGALGQGGAGGLGHAEVDHLGHRLIVVESDQDVGGLDVAVDDALLVRVLDGLADGDEQPQVLSGGVRRRASQNSVMGTP